MKTKFTIRDVDTSEVQWILLYAPENEIPFSTLFGSAHVWNWDFCTGNLLKDGAPLPASDGHAISIEAVEE